MFTKSLSLLATVLALSACNAGQPRVYTVAVNLSPLLSINDARCYRGGNLPTNRATVNQAKYFADTQWIIWDGIEGNQYLDVGSLTFKLGDSPTIEVSDLIEGAAGAFAGQRQVVEPLQGAQNTSEQRSTSVGVTFDNLGASPTGSMRLTSAYACAGQNCPMNNPSPDAAQCEATIGFIARRVDVSNVVGYAPEAQSLRFTGANP